MQKKIITTALVLVAIALSASGEKRMRVNADSVNVRAKPDTKVETVEPQLSEGDMVTVKSILGEWAEIVPPNTSDLYVYGEFVKDGVIQVSKLRVRSGPSISYKEVGMVNRGDRVDVRGMFGDWAKIAPPPDTSLWVSTKYLDDPENPRPSKPNISIPEPIGHEQITDRQKTDDKPKVVKPIPRKPVPVVRKLKPKVATPRPQISDNIQRPVEPQYVPKDLDLIPLKGQGSMNRMEGILRSSGISLFSRAPADFRLVVVRGNGFKTICYIEGNDRQLKTFVGKALKIEGREYWVRGEDVPVIVPTKIIPSSLPVIE